MSDHGQLRRELDALAPALSERLARRGFRADQLLAWASTIGGDPLARNRLPGRVEPPPRQAIVDVARDEEYATVGRTALAEGRVAICVLAGGMATRMGGVVKALVEALPGITFLDLRLAEIQRLGEQYGALPPLWLMTSEATDRPIREALVQRGWSGERAATFEQFVSLRLTKEGGLFISDGEPSVYATGHGDLPDALQRSGLVDGFIARGGRYVWISNLDNVGARVDEAVLGQHVASGKPVTAEVVDKRAGDTGGGPVLHDGHTIIAESFRLPADFDQSSVPVFNTNTFLVNALDLARLQMPWTFLEVHKKVDGVTAVQFERLIGEMTMALETQMLRVPRDGDASRFLPVKSFDDLAQIKGHLEAIAGRLGL
jgi:UTP--glucose-1-phosphate uridylyltransferase